MDGKLKEWLRRGRGKGGEWKEEEVKTEINKQDFKKCKREDEDEVKRGNSKILRGEIREKKRCNGG